jgi:hypothetical protein
LPLHLLRARRSSLSSGSTDSFDKTNYGTAGYLGHGYFITVKHAVVALSGEDDRQTRKIAAIKIRMRRQGSASQAHRRGRRRRGSAQRRLGDHQDPDLDLPSLRVDTAFPYEFADPIFRLGNDYSKGIIL